MLLHFTNVVSIGIPFIEFVLIFQKNSNTLKMIRREVQAK